jgi:hypothetical protein
MKKKILIVILENYQIAFKYAPGSFFITFNNVFTLIKSKNINATRKEIKLCLWILGYKETKHRNNGILLRGYWVTKSTLKTWFELLEALKQFDNT